MVFVDVTVPARGAVEVHSTYVEVTYDGVTAAALDAAPRAMTADLFIFDVGVVEVLVDLVLVLSVTLDGKE